MKKLRTTCEKIMKEILRKAKPCALSLSQTFLDNAYHIVHYVAVRIGEVEPMNPPAFLRTCHSRLSGILLRKELMREEDKKDSGQAGMTRYIYVIQPYKQERSLSTFESLRIS
jgi:hypothetical protein